MGRDAHRRGRARDRAANAFRAYRDGQPAGMSTLVEEVTPLLWAVARQQGLHHQAAEDVVQNTWLKLVEHAPDIADPQSVLKWLITTTQRDHGPPSPAATARSRPPTPTCVTSSPTSRHPPPRSPSSPTPTTGSCWQHFATLPERCKALLRAIAFAEQARLRRVAQALGMPVGSIGPTRGRCLAKLRLALAADPRWEMPS